MLGHVILAVNTQTYDANHVACWRVDVTAIIVDVCQHLESLGVVQLYLVN